KWQGVFGGMYGLASVIGPQVGGWIVDHTHWSWVFYINLPVGFIAAAIIAVALPSNTTKKEANIDFLGIFTMLVGVISLLLALSLGGTEVGKTFYAWNSWQIISLFSVAAIFIFVFIMVENKANDPILPIQLFQNKTFTILNGIG